ncbi:hypothetical protein [Millisia brevis]|uniref:hypothetical protein n=1 Tax=Millisia brevis TaxID=264148 RepID=UPI00082A6584|nr:hypothetical protein [Millisia brevis]
MLITGALFADHVEGNGAKADITGGVWDYVTVPREHVGTGHTGFLQMVVLGQATPDDLNRDHIIHAVVYDPDGVAVGGIDFEYPGHASTAENRVLWFPVEHRITKLGRYGFRVWANDRDDQGISIGLDLRADDRREETR